MSAFLLTFVEDRRPWWGLGFVRITRTYHYRSPDWYTRDRAEAIRRLTLRVKHVVSATIEEIE